jgi:hypothetical protein
MSSTRYALVLFCAVGAASCAPDAVTTAPTGSPSLSQTAAGAAAVGAALTSSAQVVRWSGTARLVSEPANEVPECAGIPCDRFDLKVDLPAGVWQNRPGGVQVALRWAGFGKGLTLYVYRNGERVAASEGYIASAQSVLVPTPANGTYQVYVAYDFVTPFALGMEPSAEIPYEALAEVEYTPNRQPARALLPDLAARPQRNVTFSVPPTNPLFEAGQPIGSCFPTEVEEENARLCLRFDQVLANAGEGPLELRFQVPATPPAPDAGPTFGPIVQRVYRSDGATTDRVGGEWEYHATHGHYHYTGFALSRLWTVDAAGKRGAAPVRSRRHSAGRPGVVAGTARKVSFCAIDVEIDAWGRKGDAPRGYSAQGCLERTLDGYIVQGLSAGWADVYDWFLPDQYLDVYGLSDGLYLLETVADPNNTILEADETNNCGAVYVRLAGLATANPQATLVGPAPSCGR